MSLETDYSLSYRKPKYYEKKEIVDFELSIFFKFCYLIETDLGPKIVFTLEDEKLLDSGLAVGIYQEDNIVDIQFIGNKDIKNVKFGKLNLNANGKKYKYNKLKVKICNGDAYLVSKDNHECICRLNSEIFDMVSIILGKKEEEKCVISVINSQICACEINDGKITSVKPIDIGNNKINEENTKIRSKGGEEHDISDCYLRKCSKNIYLHVDANPSDTLILGKTDSSSSLDEMNW